MNAFELYEAVFDSARHVVASSREDRVQDIIDYADNVYDIAVSSAVAAQIAAAHESYKGVDEDSGEFDDAFFHKVRQPLSEIEL